jgi:FkbM family methyltransferase
MQELREPPRLIFDIGFNNGDDTAHYLARGFDVVAVEANPELVEAGRRRFADAIAAGRLKLLGVGVGEAPGNATFYVNLTEDKWSSFVPEFGQRGGRFTTVAVPIATLSALFAEHGTPYYVKIDVEGYEWISASRT